MKLLLISDLHGVDGTLDDLSLILDKEKPDGIVISGDITTRDETGFLSRLFDLIRETQVPAFMVWGNADEKTCIKMIDESEFSIHLKQKQIGNSKIFGISMTDDPIMPDPNLIKDAILVTHRPPLKAQLEKKYSNAPKFHISGHLHSLAFAKKYPSTMHIQVPTLQNGRYALFNPDKETVEFFSV